MEIMECSTFHSSQPPDWELIGLIMVTQSSPKIGNPSLGPDLVYVKTPKYS